MDPYRWLETETEDVVAWTRAQDGCAQQVLTSLPHYGPLRARLEALLTGERTGQFVQAGDRFFHRLRKSGAELWSFWVSDSPAGEKRPLIDPATMFGEPRPKLAATYPSPLGRFVAFQLSQEGSSLMPLRILDVDSGRVLDDCVPEGVNPIAHLWHSHNRVAWTTDERGFYYSRCPEEAPSDEVRYHQKIYFHLLGEDFAHDELIFGHALPREKTVIPYLSEADRHLIISVHDHSGKTPTSEVFVRDLGKPSSSFQCRLAEAPGLIDICVQGQVAFLKTDRNETQDSIVCLDLSDASANSDRLETVIPASTCNLGLWVASKQGLVVETEESGVSSLSLYTHSGELKHVVELEEFATIRWMTASSDGQQVFFAVSSPFSPPRVRVLNLTSVECTTTASRDSALSTNDYEIQTVWCSSADGTRVRMHLTHRKGLEQNGQNPTILRAYGGFGVSLRPRYRAEMVPFLEQGGLYVEVNVRGGGELGKDWHRAGSRENKQNSFNDLIAAGEFLVEKGYTSKEHLGCLGWSHGGLLTTAVAVQRPDLWRAVVAGAPITDMTRFHLAHGARHWIAEFGSPENEDELNTLLSYSPYHNVPDEFAAPAILIYAPGADDRVAAWHGRKMFAQWQATSTSERPLLLRSPPRTGHRVDSNVTSTVSRDTDIMAFFFWQLGMAPLSGGSTHSTPSQGH